MSTRVLGIGALAAALAVLPGCIDFMGFPPSFLYEDQGDDDASLFDEERECTVHEREPNDNDGDWELDSVGLIEDGKTITVCAEIDDTGIADDWYSGDQDYFVVELLEDLELRVQLEPESSDAYYDLWMIDGDDWITAWSIYGEDTLVRDIDAGLTYLMVGGNGGPSGDYTLEIRGD